MITNELCDYLGYDFNAISNYVKSYKPVKELEFIHNCENHRKFIKLTSSEKETLDYGFMLLKKSSKKDLVKDLTYEDYSNNKITVGNQKRKLFSYLGDQKLAEEIGTYKLPKGDVYLVLSTNFDDFLMCSTGNSWTSCTNIEHGDFRFGTLSSIYVKDRFIIYLTDKKETGFKGLQSYKMMIRSFGYVNERSQLRSILFYPIKLFFDIKTSEIEIPHTIKEEKSKYSFMNGSLPLNNEGVYVTPYFDCCSKDDNNGVLTFHDSLKSYRMIIGNNNDYLDYYENLYTANSEGSMKENTKSHCDFCGQFGLVKTFNGKNYCKECFKKHVEKCTSCGKIAHTVHTEDNTYLCPDCQQKFGYKQTCFVCGDAKRPNNFKSCRFCRSPKADAFNSPYLHYWRNGNFYAYDKHDYVGDDGFGAIVDKEKWVFNEETGDYVSYDKQA